MSRVIISGDSHLGCLKKAAGTSLHSEFKDLVFWPLGRAGKATTQFYSVSPDKNEVRVSSDRWGETVFSKETTTLGTGPALTVLSFPLNTSRIHRAFSWSTHVPWNMKQRDDETGLSDAVVSAVIDQDSKHAIAFVRALVDADIDLAVLEGPRFFENAPYLNDTRFDVVKHIEESYRDQVKTALDALGVPVIAQPADTIAENGYTKLEFDHENVDDIHHANASYGAITLKHILEFARQKSAA